MAAPSLQLSMSKVPQLQLDPSLPCRAAPVSPSECLTDCRTALALLAVPHGSLVHAPSASPFLVSERQSVAAVSRLTASAAGRAKLSLSAPHTLTNPALLRS